MHMYMSICMYTYTYIYTNIQIYVYVYIYICTCICILSTICIRWGIWSRWWEEIDEQKGKEIAKGDVVLRGHGNGDDEASEDDSGSFEWSSREVDDEPFA